MDTATIVNMPLDAGAENAPNLDSYLASAEFQTVDPDQLTSESGAANVTQGQPTTSQTVDDGTNGGNLTLGQDVTSLFEGDQGADEATQQLVRLQQDNQQLQALIRAAAIENLKQEEAALLNRVQGLDEPTREAEIEKFKAQRAIKFAQMQSQAVQSQQQAIESSRQVAAKSQVAYHVSQHYGLPQQELRTLMTAQTPQQMEAIAQSLARAYGARNMQQRAAAPQATQQQVGQQQQLHPNARVAGGATSPSAPSRGPEKRSGDILGLIQSRAYYTVGQS